MRDFEARLNKLLTWINECVPTAGSAPFVSSRITVKNSPDSGRGLYAVDHIRASEKIVTIPHSLLLNYTTVMAHISKFAPFSLQEPYYGKVNVPSTPIDPVTEIYKTFSLDTLLRLSSFQLLGLYLVLEKRRGENSFWKPFLDMLPELDELSSAPIVWTILKHSEAEHLTRMLPRSTRKHTNDVVSRFENDYNRVSDFLGSATHISKEDFLWAWMCINSRCLYMEMPQKSDASDNFTLAPYVDFLNHSGNDECGIKIDAHGFHVLTSTPYKPDSELYFSYGPHSNEFLLCEYGFTLAYNKWNYVDISDLIMPLLRPQQVAFLKESGYYGDYTVNEQGASFRTEVALATLQENEPSASRKLKAFVDGVIDGLVYQSKSWRLLGQIMKKLIGDSDKKLASEFSSPEGRALATLYKDTKMIAEKTLKGLQ
ncbi:hypothetical protein ACI3LY_003063 [Candidozyma auris]|uniref:SET domain-containing protein n=2 Tax=Candidozyma auris TaxID=498019 RepID=A0A2H0ZNE9_CANAR|nr:protein-lysine N-methyltransferase [[Candida] auris]KNE02029.2 hypothetical protein QG37_00968 [[Candida] auris]PIS52151.1 hypothetical protein B9J08_003762 [[Candida] auris]QEO21449.1 hypothetical_protein [[Candida] auris]QWW21552.1 hypothetical protein CA7LBN_000298 [[Candida] auris]